jgi:TonB family protein
MAGKVAQAPAIEIRLPRAETPKELTTQKLVRGKTQMNGGQKGALKTLGDAVKPKVSSPIAAGGQSSTQLKRSLASVSGAEAPVTTRKALIKPATKVASAQTHKRLVKASSKETLIQKPTQKSSFAKEKVLKETALERIARRTQQPAKAPVLSKTWHPSHMQSSSVASAQKAPLFSASHLAKTAHAETSIHKPTLSSGGVLRSPIPSSSGSRGSASDGGVGSSGSGASGSRVGRGLGPKTLALGGSGGSAGVRSGRGDGSVGGDGSGAGGRYGSGGGGGGEYGRASVAQIDMDGYIRKIERRVKAHWNPNAPDTSNTLVTFKIGRGGQLLGLYVSRSSGDRTMDMRCLDAIRMAAPFPPPPEGYSMQVVDVALTFDYLARR